MICLDHVVQSQEVTLLGVFSKSIVLNCDLMMFFQAKIPPKLPFSLRTKVTSREDSEAPGSPLNNIRCLTHWWRNNPQLWLIAPPQPLSPTCPAWPDHLPFWGFWANFSLALYLWTMKGLNPPSASITFCPPTHPHFPPLPKLYRKHCSAKKHADPRKYIQIMLSTHIGFYVLFFKAILLEVGP